MFLRLNIRGRQFSSPRGYSRALSTTSFFRSQSSSPRPTANMSEQPKAAKKEAAEKARADKAAEKAAKFAAKQAKLKEQQQQQNPKKAQAQPKKVVQSLPPYEDPTPPGEKKQVQPFDNPHFSAYNPSAVESSWYNWWEKSGFFQPEACKGDSKQTFVVPLPPPNVTGALHCGHALANSLQDTLVRWNRMNGITTLWVPGCDHAGISTQSVVEKTLWKKEKKTRHELGRENFTRLVWDWKDDYHKRINDAQKLMGGSMDWSREKFTMDKTLTAATMEAFCRLYDEGFIYRSDRLVNWCTQLNTALSTLEVENKEITGRTLLSVPGYEKKVEFGVLTHFKYPVDGSEETVEVATTRPETMLGDSGIAVHPDDARYKHLVGKSARHPFTNRLLPIVKDTYVDPEFGTGAVKLTPAHDFNDYQLGQRHNLEFINILNGDGTLNSNAGADFEGQKRFDARYKVVEELTKLGLFVKKESNAMKIPLCDKSKDVIEPLIKPQWWMKMTEMADAAVKAVEDDRITIAPATAKKSYQRWMSSINDWCLSRQLWWGHRIPAYRVLFEGEDSSETAQSRWVVAKSQEEAQAKAKALAEGKQFHLEQDPDCLDTWFSSGLWPMATLGWPNPESSDLKKFFPTSLLETGWDILFFWVSRMIMLSLKLTGEVPFKEVYCHSLIRDSEGRKMSKSLGNVIDPLDIIKGIELEDLHAKLKVGNLQDNEIERATKYQKSAFPSGIPECGADALRFTLLSYTTGGGDINFDIKVMHAYRRFCNKVWQASKYALGKLPEDFVPVESLDTSKLSLPERWILHRMNSACKAVDEALKAREFSKCTRILYQFFYDELCDVFIENSKAILSDGAPAEKASVQQTLYHTLDAALRLLHPTMPYITEELWQRFPKGQGDAPPTIMLTKYPTYDPALEFEADALKYELGIQCTLGVRSLMSEYNVRSNGHAFIKTSTTASYESIEPQISAIKALSGKAVTEMKILGPDTPESSLPAGCAIFVVSSEIVVMVDVASGITDVKAEIAKLQKKLEKSQTSIQKLKELMSREGFEEKASDVVLSAEKQKLVDAESASQNYKRTIEEFEKMSLGS